MKWQLTNIGQTYECGEDMVVYFDPASGDTHLLSHFACYLIRLFAAEQTPLDSAAIIKLASSDIEPEDIGELQLAIPGMLEELASLDILAQA